MTSNPDAEPDTCVRKSPSESSDDSCTDSNTALPRRLPPAVSVTEPTAVPTAGCPGLWILCKVTVRRLRSAPRKPAA